MKRRITSDRSIGGALKRRSSSLFSIDTINDTPSRPPSEVNLTSNLKLEKDTTIHVKAISFTPDATETEVSSSDGFYIDEESDEETGNHKLIPTFPSESKIESTIDAKPIEPSGDLRTGIVFEAGSKHFDRHNRLHKERPVRVTSIMEALQKSSIRDKFTILEEDVEESSSEKVFLDDEDYLQVHLPGYMKRLDKLSNCTCCEKLDREAEQFNSIYFTKDSVAEAKTAATSLCRLVTKVVEGDLDNGFAVIRPPGHHAEPGVAGGYCVINNVAIAASYAREKLGVDKVLIVDWDVHHGNGTQAIFLNDPNVLYFSVHRWHGGNFFPFLQKSGPSNVGLGDGEGYNVNVGWTRKGMGDEEYLAVWEKILMPIAREFQPDLVLVSAGFDAALGDMGTWLVAAAGTCCVCLHTLYSCVSHHSNDPIRQENAMSRRNALVY